MRKTTIHIFILLFTASVLISSCKKDIDVIPFNISGFFTANTDSKAHIYKLTDDMGNIYNVKDDDLIMFYNSKTMKYDMAYDTAIRVVATVYAEDNGKYVIASKAIPISGEAPDYLPESKKGRDPIKLKSIYIGGGHLNIIIGLMTENEQIKHDLSYMVKNNSEHIRFKLYHNADGDKPVYTKDIYLSIPLAVHNIQKNDTVLFSYKSFEGDCVEKLVYR